MAAYFPNGMMAVSEAFYGRTHNSKLMHECGWLDILRAAGHCIVDAYSPYFETLTKLRAAARRFGRNSNRLFAVAAILMNMRATFYGNQLTHELNNAMRMSLSELLALAEQYRRFIILQVNLAHKMVECCTST
jgi:hypothetical protein